MIVDTSALKAFFDSAEEAYPRLDHLFATTDEALIVSPLVLAELDHLLLTRLGVAAEVAALRELVSGAWQLATVTSDQVAAAIELVEHYADDKIGLTDALTVVLAQHHRTTTVATLDQRHFRVLKRPDGQPLEIVP
jgi:predicted nucleic acid-binding protein